MLTVIAFGLAMQSKEIVMRKSNAILSFLLTRSGAFLHRRLFGGDKVNKSSGNGLQPSIEFFNTLHQ